MSVLYHANFPTPSPKNQFKFVAAGARHFPDDDGRLLKDPLIFQAPMKDMKKNRYLTLRICCGIFLFLAVSCSKPKPVSFAGYRNLRFSNEGFTTGIIRLDVAFYNPNPFPMKIKETALTVSIDRQPLGEITQDSLSQMPARDTFLMPVSFKVNLLDLVNKVLGASSRDSVLLEATGECKIGRSGVFMKLPLHYHSKEILRMF